ncbi:MAG: L-seryl-tRNA(Sec) selenium transferase [Ilumatobacteraceae bacterium]
MGTVRTDGAGTNPDRPPSVDALARALARSVALPHAVLVDCARTAIANGGTDHTAAAERIARGFASSLVGDVVNATGVLLHTNLGRAPLPWSSSGRASNVEFDLTDGSRGSRHDAVSALVRMLTGAEAAVVVNNNAAAVMLVLGALARGRGVAVSRGESVEIGGGFRIPEVMEQSGARLVDVGTTNRTRASDYAAAVASSALDVALVMRIHPSNFSVEGFTESADVSELRGLGVPVVSDIGSGLLDSTCPWLHGRTDDVPAFLGREPAARQTLSAGADLVTFSGDKLLGGPQCGIVAGRADLVAACAAHPLMRALRPGSHTVAMLQAALMSFAARTACDDIPFWSMLAAGVDSLGQRASAIVAASGRGSVVESVALVGAGSAPGAQLASRAVAMEGDVSSALRSHGIPVVARVVDGRTLLDMRSIAPTDDRVVIDAVRALP